jgi:hypothetical protein
MKLTLNLNAAEYDELRKALANDRLSINQDADCLQSRGNVTREERQAIIVRGDALDSLLKKVTAEG